MRIEEIKKTGGSFRTKGYTFTAVANTTTQFDVQFPHDVEILSAFFHTKNSNDGDKIDAHIAPDTITGTITEAGTTSQDWIKVSQTVIDNTEIGYQFNLNGDLYTVISIDKINLKITLDRNLDNAVAVNDYVKQSIIMIEDFYLFTDKGYEIGESKIGASLLPTGKIIRIKYTNTGTSDLTFQFNLELLY